MGTCTPLIAYLITQHSQCPVPAQEARDVVVSHQMDSRSITKVESDVDQFTSPVREGYAGDLPRDLAL